MAQWQLMAGNEPAAGLPVFDDGAPGGPGDAAFDTSAVKDAAVKAGASSFNYVGPSPEPAAE